MKKLGLIALVAMFAGATALAGTAVIPFFVDTAGTTWSNQIPGSPSGAASFIRVINKSGGTITCTVAYALVDGSSAGPASGNTFALTAGQGIGWRPGNDDSVNESATARAIGNMSVAYPLQVGSCTITWTGAGANITAALAQISSSSAGMQGMYGPFEGID